LEPIKINLATFEYQDKRLSYTVMLLTALIVLIVSIFSIRSAANTQTEIKEYEKKIAEQEQNIIKRQKIRKENIKKLNDAEIKSLKKNIDFVNGLINKDAYPYDRLLDLFELCVPQGIVLSSFKMSKDLDEVVVEGKADSMNEITVFLNKLNESKSYKKNNLLNLSIAQKNNAHDEPISVDDGIKFEIESVIDGDKIWIEQARN
jgi:Tfp pilus assembly protein PilN